MEISKAQKIVDDWIKKYVRYFDELTYRYFNGGGWGTGQNNV